MIEGLENTACNEIFKGLNPFSLNQKKVISLWAVNSNLGNNLIVAGSST